MAEVEPIGAPTPERPPIPLDPEERGESRPGLTLEGVTVRFPGFQLGPLDLQMHLGERWALAGVNGSGKTTTVRVVTGRLRDFEGRVTLLGTDVAADPPGARTRLGVLPERRTGFGWMTVREHLDFLAPFHPTWDAAYARELQNRFGLSDREPVGALSTGMRLRLALVAAEAFRPPVLLLDEPTSGIDPIGRDHLLEMLDELVPPGGDRLLIFSTHILEDLERLRPRIAVLRGGQLRRIGTSDELLPPDPDDPHRRLLLKEMRP